MSDAPDEMTSKVFHNKWVLWYDNPRLAPSENDWKDNLKNCGAINCPEEFWTVINNIKPASQLALNSNYHLFKEGIEPMWEDPQNKEGGKFVLTIPKKESKAGRCDDWWLYTMLAVVGETIDNSGDVVCGAVVSIRKSQDRIALWLKSNDRAVATSIGQRWKKALEVTNKTSLKYQAHKDAFVSGSSFTNEIKFVV
uniref:Eukaryotic translation initiation factor 4E n=1 Tax=Proboscia inermis TaxID=420281 RepID=A0A7S0CFY3_9STRA|mmetsp:Transcript_44382/g.44904  ORF Transcript_44382/g.44904 Transcript_44382/m.44904 type:complete len:196 (+) Transcript_44382:202-789(+)|eukprot:CAMPEP_0194352376 /NCGR_PEP_ID=MMETSP0174-20130528/776_1 /TAXON_ID=216777 /ORGANISM="Proboscia alata, Strain PI-D3" /LENGTH=195 /DNA_ID=CAMNT_0039120389 /DNA_START=218 /DNA_END=805 /DNA_ORIENTATION=+